MPLQLPVVQTGLEASIQAAMKNAGRNASINLGTSAREIGSLSQPLGRITGQADQFTKSMEAANARVFAFGASVGIINSVTSAFKGLVASTIAVESSLASIYTVLDKTGSSTKEFETGLFEVAKKTGQSFKVAADGALELARQGLSSTEVLKRLNDSLILTRLSGLDSADAVEGLSAAFNSFRSSGITTAEILNKLVAVSQKYAVSEKDLIEGIKRAGSTAQQAGVSFDELAGLITAVQERTARGGAVIGNSFKTIFARLQDRTTLEYLSDLGIGVTDLEGKVLPATRIMEGLAKEFNNFSQIEQSDIAEKLGGIYQLSNLLAAIQDLTSAQSKYAGAVKVSQAASEQAYQKNAVLNQTLESILNRVSVSAEQLGATLGELGVTDNLKSILNFFTGLLDGIQKVLQEDSGIGKFFRGLVAGIGNLISGPGLALFGAIILKLSKDLVQFGFSSLKSFFGIGQAAREIANVEKSVAQALSTNVSLQQRLLAVEGDRAAQLKIISGEIIAQEAMLRKIANTSSAIAPGLYGAGVRSTGQGLRVPKAAEGYMPAVAEEASSVKRGVGGAKPSDKPVVIPNFNFGGGKRGTMVANSGEHIVPNFNGSGGSAIFNRDMVRKMGMPSGAQKINSAGGFIPNYADKKILKWDKSNNLLSGNKYLLSSEEYSGVADVNKDSLKKDAVKYRKTIFKIEGETLNKRATRIIEKGSKDVIKTALGSAAGMTNVGLWVDKNRDSKQLKVQSLTEKRLVNFKDQKQGLHNAVKGALFEKYLLKNRKDIIAFGPLPNEPLDFKFNNNVESVGIEAKAGGFSNHSLIAKAIRSKYSNKYKDGEKNTIENVGTVDLFVPSSANGFIPNFAISQREAAYNAWDSPIKQGKEFSFINRALANPGNTPNKAIAKKISDELDAYIAKNSVQIREAYQSNKQEGVVKKRSDTTGAVAEFGMMYPSNSKGSVSSFVVGSEGEVVKGIPIIGKPSDDLYPEVEKGIINAGINYAKNLGFKPDIIQEDRFAAGIKSNLNPGTIEAAFGTVFESVFQSAMGVPPNVNQTFDLPDKSKLNSFVNSMQTGGILKNSIAGNINPEMLAADFKNNLSANNLNSMAQKISAFREKQAARKNIVKGAKGFIPNFADPIKEAVGREMSAGVPASQIYIDQDSSLKNSMNPGGFMVANRRDEPTGGIQGINRARKEGSNPITYGASRGFVPNYANTGPGSISGSSQTAQPMSTTSSTVSQSAAVSAATNAIAAAIASAVTKALASSAPAPAPAPVASAKLPVPTPAKPNAIIKTASEPPPPKGGMSSEKMLGTIFAIQGGLSLLSGAFKDSASGIGKYTSIVVDSLSNVSTAMFAMSGFSSIASSGNKLMSIFGKLGQAGAIAYAGWEAFKGAKELYYELSGANERAAKAANSLADAAQYAAAKLEDYDPTQQASIKKQAEEYVSQLEKGTYQFIGQDGKSTTTQIAPLEIDSKMRAELAKAFEMLISGSVTKKEMDTSIKNSLNLQKGQPGEPLMFPSLFKMLGYTDASNLPDYTKLNPNFLNKEISPLLKSSSTDPEKVKQSIINKTELELQAIIDDEKTILDLSKDQTIEKYAIVDAAKKRLLEITKTRKEEETTNIERNLALEKYFKLLNSESIFKKKINELNKLSSEQEIQKQKDLSSLSNDLTVSAEDRSKIESLINLKYEQRLATSQKQLSVLNSAKSSIGEAANVSGVDIEAKKAIMQNLPSTLETNQSAFINIGTEKDPKVALEKTSKLLGEMKVPAQFLESTAKNMVTSFMELGNLIKDSNKELENSSLKAKNLLLIDLERQKTSEKIKQSFEKYSNSLEITLGNESIKNIKAQSAISLSEMRKEAVLANPNTFSGITTQAGKIAKTQEIEKKAFEDRIKLEKEISDRQESIELSRKLSTLDNITALNSNTKKIDELIDELKNQITESENKAEITSFDNTLQSNIPSSSEDIRFAITNAVRNSGIASTKITQEQSQKFFGKDALTPGDWANLLTKIAYKESEFDPKQVYTENFKNQKGEFVKSTGLFQVSTESVNAWRAKNNQKSITQSDLLDPQKNAMIAAQMMKQMIESSGGVIAGGSERTGYQGLSKYWSVMRGNRDLETINTQITGAGTNIPSSNNIGINTKPVSEMQANILKYSTELQQLKPDQLTAKLEELNKSLNQSSEQASTFNASIVEIINKRKIETEQTNAQITEFNKKQEYERNREKGTFTAGLSNGLTLLDEKTQEFQNKFGEEIPGLFSSSLAAGIEGALDGTKSIKDSLLDAAMSFTKALSNRAIGNFADIITGGIGGIGSMFGQGNKIPTGASGGAVYGGSGSKDDVPAMLMGGEYIINKKSVNKYGPRFLEAINSGKLDGYAKGGRVKDYFTPGTYGVKQMTTKDDLLGFATQEYTSGSRDKIRSGNGFASVALEPESIRLTNFGRRNSPEAQRAKDVRKQMFGIYIDEMRKAAELKKQEEEEKKARKKAIKNMLIMAGVSIAGSVLMGSVTSGFKNAYSTSKLAGGATAQNLGAGFKGAFTGGGVSGLQGNNYGGMFNMFSNRGGVTKASQITGLISNKDFIGPIQDSSKVNINPSAQNYVKTSSLNEPDLPTEGSTYYNPTLFPPGFLQGYTPTKRATGGEISETAGIDTIPTMLSGGEFVMNRAAAENIGPGNLQAMNAGASKPMSEEASKELNNKLISKFDELIGTTEKSTGAITINVDGSTGKTSESSNNQNGTSNQQLSRQIKDAVLKVIQEEKRLGGQLRRGM